MNGGPIQVCPVCQYDLQTLPRNYRCPECGFEYEPTMRVWVVGFPKSKVVSALVIFSIVCVGVAAKLVLWPGTAFPGRLAVPLAVLPFVVLFDVTRYFILRGFIVVGIDGITYKFGRQVIEFRPWSELRLNDSIWTMDLLDFRPALPKYLPTKFLKKQESHELRNEIVRRLKYYNAGLATATPSTRHAPKPPT